MYSDLSVSAVQCRVYTWFKIFLKYFSNKLSWTLFEYGFIRNTTLLNHRNLFQYLTFFQTLKCLCLISILQLSNCDVTFKTWFQRKYLGKLNSISLIQYIGYNSNSKIMYTFYTRIYIVLSHYLPIFQKGKQKAKQFLLHFLKLNSYPKKQDDFFFIHI